jgi:hypothetical protein
MKQGNLRELAGARHSLRFRGLTSKRQFVRSAVLDPQRDACRPRPGDVVRFEFGEDGLWFYCWVERLLDHGELSCKVVEAQSWPELGAIGILPGRSYVAPGDCVLSIVSRNREPVRRGSVSESTQT